MIKKIVLTLGLVVIATLVFISFFIISTVKNASLPGRNYNFLLLGLDPRDDAIEKTETTDTIIFASFNFEKRYLSITSLPRDLWNFSTGTKINQIYPNSLKSNSTPDFNKIRKEFTPIIGQKIDSILIITTREIAEIVDILGGVSLFLENSIIDNHYPNPDYILHPNPKTPVYITVQFPAGENIINGSNVIPFVRSRKSSDNPILGGTDLGRINRQQQLIDAIIKKIGDIRRLKPVEIYHLTKRLNRFWHTAIFKDINDQTLLALALKFALSSPPSIPISLSRSTLPIEDVGTSGIIYHPEKFNTGAWVFIPRANDYQEIHQFIQKQIN